MLLYTVLQKAWASVPKLGAWYDPSVIPFQKAHDLYIKNLLWKIEKLQLFINKIFKFVKKMSKKPPFFVGHVPKLYERYRQVWCIFRELLIRTFKICSDITPKLTFLFWNLYKFWGNFAILAKIARFRAHFSEFKQVLAIFSKFATFNYVKLDIKLHFKRGYKHKIQNFWKFCNFARASYIINPTLWAFGFSSKPTNKSKKIEPF